MPKISVIVPVYNVEKVLRRCLDSIIAQTFGDWEAVCLDDGSTDGSPLILDEYAAKDSRIKVAHRENAGVSRARNAAIKMATGKYMIFVDSDDFIHPQTMELCHYLAERDSSDLVAYTYNRKFRTGLTVRHFLGLPEPPSVRFKTYAPETLETKVTDDIFAWATESSHPKDIDRKWAVKHCQPWRCLYRTECISHIEFIPGIIYEDFPWWGEVLLNVRRATILNLPLYYYYPNFSGYIHSSSQKYRIESLVTAIAATEDTFGKKATAYQRDRWEKMFLNLFREKLAKKMRKEGL